MRFFAGDRCWQLPVECKTRAFVTEEALHQNEPNQTQQQDEQKPVKWKECQCLQTGALYYVRSDTNAAQWVRPEDGNIPVEPLDWTLNSLALSLSPETKFGAVCGISMALLAGGFFHGYQKEQRKYKQPGSGGSRVTENEFKHYSQNQHSGRTRRRLRSKPLDPRHVAAGQAMRALGIATIGSFASFGGLILLTAAAMQVSSAKEFGDRMRDTLPRAKQSIENVVRPMSQSIRSRMRDLSIVQSAREFRRAQAPQSDPNTNADADVDMNTGDLVVKT